VRYRPLRWALDRPRQGRGQRDRVHRRAVHAAAGRADDDCAGGAVGV